MTSIESEFRLKGFRIIAGVDEAGRGALAGPLSVGMVILPEKLPDALSELDDSKKLSASKREELVPQIQKFALFAAVVYQSNRRIDKIGIQPATELAILLLYHRAGLAQISPDLILMDGNSKFPKLAEKTSVQSIIKGDSLVKSISAASILAKTGRDNRMFKWAKYYRDYSFDKHVGYGTKEHIEVIDGKGYTRLHRKTFQLNEDRNQILLFE